MTKADREERRSKKLERQLREAKLEADQLRIEAAKLKVALAFILEQRSHLEARLKSLAESGTELKAEKAA